MARLHCLLAAVAAVLLAAAPLHAQQQQQQLAQRATFVATLAPLPNTTGVDLGGSGSARLTFEGCDAASDACAASNIELTVAGLNSPIVAVHVHKGLPSENGPIFLAVCGNTPAFTVQVVNSAPGRGTFTETGARCLQRASATYAALPLASPKPGGFRALRPSFDAIRADPFGYYVNVHTQASERIAPDNGQIRGQLQPA